VAEVVVLAVVVVVVAAAAVEEAVVHRAAVVVRHAAVVVRHAVAEVHHTVEHAVAVAADAAVGVMVRHAVAVVVACAGVADQAACGVQVVVLHLDLHLQLLPAWAFDEVVAAAVAVADSSEAVGVPDVAVTEVPHVAVTVDAAARVRVVDHQEDHPALAWITAAAAAALGLAWAGPQLVAYQ
jgi:hypothetical protein